MTCPRCNQGELDFITLEDGPNESAIFEYLCMVCLLYYQECYKLTELQFTASGDIGR